MAAKTPCAVCDEKKRHGSTIVEERHTKKLLWHKMPTEQEEAREEIVVRIQGLPLSVKAIYGSTACSCLQTTKLGCIYPGKKTHEVARLTTTVEHEAVSAPPSLPPQARRRQLITEKTKAFFTSGSSLAPRLSARRTSSFLTRTTPSRTSGSSSSVSPYQEEKGKGCRVVGILEQKQLTARYCRNTL